MVRMPLRQFLQSRLAATAHERKQRQIVKRLQSDLTHCPNDFWMDNESQHGTCGSVPPKGYRLSKIPIHRCHRCPRIEAKRRQSHAPTGGVNVHVVPVLDFSIGKNSCASAYYFVVTP